jgi:suppressor of ftsI/bilirubin oxidase
VTHPETDAEGLTWFGAVDLIPGQPTRIAITALDRSEEEDAARLAAIVATAAGSIANPTLRTRTGQQLDVEVSNRLGEDTTIHWHGLVVDWNQDGHPRHHIAPGDSRAYSFPVLNRGSLYWYHPHPHGRTASQVYRGVAGMLVVTDPEDDAVRSSLGVDGGPNEIVAMIRSESPLRAAGEARGSAAPGDVLTVNGEVGTRWQVDPGWIRLRLLNGSNSRILLLGCESDSDGPVPTYLLGTDGGLLEAPLAIEKVFLAPGERLDLALDAGNRQGETIRIISHPLDPLRDAPGHGGHEGHGSGGSDVVVEMATLEIGPGPARPGLLPPRLSSLPPPDETAPVRRWDIELDSHTGAWLIAWNTYDPDRPFRIPARPELWELASSERSMPHPMHLHGAGFRVVRREGSPDDVVRHAVDARGRLPTDLGVKDTVLVWPGETVRIAVDLRHPFDAEQHLLYHCHILEHEDAGMMADLLIV